MTTQELKQETVQTDGLDDLAGKYLTFKLANEEYGIEILKVMEIIKLMTITQVPQTPHYIRGVINLRGKVIPVVDLRLKFSMEAIDDTDATCIIVVSIKSNDRETQMGILVDTVSEVLDINAGEIEGPPRFGAAVDTEFIMGMAKARGEVKILLDIDKVLSGAEVANLEMAI